MSSTSTVCCPRSAGGRRCRRRGDRRPRIPAQSRTGQAGGCGTGLRRPRPELGHGRGEALSCWFGTPPKTTVPHHRSALLIADRTPPGALIPARAGRCRRVRRWLRPRRYERPDASGGRRLVGDRFGQCGYRCDACQSRAVSRRSGRSAWSRRMGRAVCMSSASLVAPWSVCRLRSGAKVPVCGCRLGLGSG